MVGSLSIRRSDCSWIVGKFTVATALVCIVPLWRTITIIKVHGIGRINRHSVNRDEIGSPPHIWNTEDRLDRNEDWHYPNNSEDNRAVDIELWYRSSQKHRGSGMPWAAGFELRQKCSFIVSAYTEVKETRWTDVDDGQCNWNETNKEGEGKVGQNASIFHQLLCVSWL